MTSQITQFIALQRFSPLPFLFYLLLLLFFCNALREDNKETTHHRVHNGQTSPPATQKEP